MVVKINYSGDATSITNEGNFGASLQLRIQIGDNSSKLSTSLFSHAAYFSKTRQKELITIIVRLYKEYYLWTLLQKEV